MFVNSLEPGKDYLSSCYPRPPCLEWNFFFLYLWPILALSGNLYHAKVLKNICNKLKKKYLFYNMYHFKSLISNTFCYVIPKSVNVPPPTPPPPPPPPPPLCYGDPGAAVYLVTLRTESVALHKSI